jgi:ribosomal subunit interface protein
MDIVVVGKHVEVSDELKQEVHRKVEPLARFAPDARRVDVEFGHIESRRAEDSHSCDVLVHLNRKLVKGHATAADPEHALDRAVTKAEEQLRRLHERRVDKPVSRRDGGPGNHSGAPS